MKDRSSKLSYQPDDIDQARFKREIKKSLDAFSQLLDITREKALNGHDFWAEWHLNFVLNLMSGEADEEGFRTLRIEHREIPDNILELFEENRNG